MIKDEGRGGSFLSTVAFTPIPPIPHPPGLSSGGCVRLEGETMQ